MVGPTGLYREQMGAKTQTYVLFKAFFFGAVTTPAYQNNGSPPSCSGCITMPLLHFTKAYMISLDLDGGERPLVWLVYPPRPSDISAGGLAFWSKMDILGLWVHSSDLVLQHTMEVEQCVGLV